MQIDQGTGPITMVGDLDAIASAIGGNSSNMQFGLTLKADGTGSLVSGEETYAVTWTDNGKGVTLKAAATSASAASASASAASDSASASSASAGALGAFGDSVDLAYSDGALALSMEQNGQSGAVYFSKDGTMPGMSEISAEKAKPITNEADLVGTWNLTGMNMLGMSIYGSPDSLKAMMGNVGTDMTVTFEAGGKGTMSGSTFAYTVGADGASMDSGGQKVELKSLDGDLMMDMSAQLGMPMVIVFAK